MLKPKPRRVLQLPIVTKRLTLRDFTTGDFAAVYHYSSDPRVTRFLFFGPRDAHNTVEYLDDLVASQSEVPRTRFELASRRTGRTA